LVLLIIYIIIFSGKDYFVKKNVKNNNENNIDNQTFEFESIDKINKGWN